MSTATPGRRHHPFAGLLWMVVATTLFAVMSVLARLASERLPWSEVAAARALVSAIVAIGIALARRAPLKIHDRPKAWMRSVCGTAALVCVFYTLGAPEISVGDLVTLGSISPVFIALLSPWLLGEPSGRGLWVAIVLATAGVGLVAGADLRTTGHLAALSVLGAFFSALAMIWLRKMRVGADASRAGAAPSESPEAIVVHFSLVASVTMVAVALPSLRAPDRAGAALLAAMGVCGGLAQLAMTRAYALEKAARLGTVGYLGVVLSHLMGAAVLGELPTTGQALGSALVIAAGVLLALITLRDMRSLERSAAGLGR